MRRAMTRVGFLAGRIVAFRRDLSGLSAVEFALLLPLMLTLYVTGNEISTAIAINRKVTILARTVTDLVSRSTTVSTNDMSGILAASAAVIAPYTPNSTQFTVSQIKIDSNGNQKIDWSCTYQGTAHSPGTTVTPAVPSQLVTIPPAGQFSYLIWGEAQFSYTPPIGYVISGTLVLKDQIYLAPRMSQSVTGPGTCPTTFT
jgi:Flp pilus assembly protein TadG